MVFENNVGEDRLSSQSTYKVNIDCLYYKASIAPNCKILNDLKPSKEHLEKVYGGIMEEVDNLRLQIARKNSLSAIDRQGKIFYTNIARVQAKKGLTKCTANEFVQSCFQDCFLGVLYI
jgi:hypothetical protein